MVWTPRVTVAAIISHQGRYLLVEEEENGICVRNQPAGHLEEGENLIDAVVRETFEETGGDFIPSSVVGIYRWQHPEKQLTFLRFCIHGTLADPNINLIPQDKDILRTVWLNYEDIKQSQHLRSPLVLQCIDDFERGCSYPLSLLKDSI